MSSKVTLMNVKSHAIHIATASFAFLIALLGSSAVCAQGVTVPGSFNVNSAGAAMYTIPVQAPAGIAGVQPKVALSYSSQSGSGLMGLGWNIDGLSAITRCPRNMAQDGVIGGINYDANDRFCLDGSRLMQISGFGYGSNGSEYRTEIDGFNQIKAFGVVVDGPSYFIVKTKSGLTMEYGNSLDSKVEVQGSNRVRLWALNKVTDVKGNYMTWTYVEDNATGEYRPSRIDYTGTTSQAPTNSIRFEYESRPDIVPRFQAGGLIKNTQRLARTKAFIGSNLIKEYRLAYSAPVNLVDKSKLVSVTECDAASNCLVATTINWPAVPTPPTSIWGDSSSLLLPKPISYDPMSNMGVQLIDLNGDGLLDFVYSRWLGGVSESGTWLNTGSGWTKSDAYALPKPLAINVVSDAGTRLIDLNGDGLPDFIYGRYTGTTFAPQTWLNTGSGWQEVFNFSAPKPISIDWLGDAGVRLVDVNGDGLPDFVYGLWNGGVFTSNTWLNTGSSWVPAPNFAVPVPLGISVVSDSGVRLVDLNGDGLVDILYSRHTGADWLRSAWINDGTKFVETTAYTPQVAIAIDGLADAGVRLIDLNGDGLPDIVYSLWYNTVVTKNTWLNTGQGWVAAPDFIVPTPIGINVVGDSGVRFVDLNGDGLPDILYQRWTGGVVLSDAWLNTGTRWFEAQNYFAPAPLALDPVSDSGVRLVDIDGDGLPDFVYARDTGAGVLQKIGINKSPPNLVSSISTNASDSSLPGVSYSIRYSSLVNSSVYTRDTSATFPKVNLRIPMQVVAEVQTSNGVGYSNSTAYTYGGLKAEVGTGRGMLGFRWMKALDNSAWIETYTNFSQDWPYLGLPVETGTRNGPGGSLLKRNTITLDCKRPQLSMQCWINPGNTYFPFVSQTYEESWDLNGTAFPTITTQTRYTQQGVQGPMWGDPLQITVTNSDGSSKTVDNTYRAADTSNWVLGRLLRTTVTHVKP